MAEVHHGTDASAAGGLRDSPLLRTAILIVLGTVLISVLAPAVLPQGYPLSVFGDSVQVGLIAAFMVLSFRNFQTGHARVGAFWLLLCLGSALWLSSMALWGVYEVFFKRPLPDSPLVDILLIAKLVPFTVAVAIAPHRHHDARLRAFGLLDVAILMIYALYLYILMVLAYRLVPGAGYIYDSHFLVAAAIDNQIFVFAAAFGIFSSEGSWRWLYRIFFLGAAGYGLASDLIDMALDQGRYYSGSFYDVPLNTAAAIFVGMALVGRPSEQNFLPVAFAAGEDSPRRRAFLSSHLAMLGMVSLPLIGIWLSTAGPVPQALYAFRVELTLATMFLLTLLLSIKQDLLTVGLMVSLKDLSETYSSINRFKTHLTQSEKLTSLGGLVAQVAKEIKECMIAINDRSARLTARPHSETRIQNLAGKIGQYASRTDGLVENMLRFAQETPLRLAPVEVKPLIESALHLSRVAKRSQVQVNFSREGACPPVRADSSQILHVFLQLISNAADALEESGGGALDISASFADSHVTIEFADSGPGVREPQRVFEPFYTTKPVGKGTGLGLSTCYGILQQHEGEITCRNRAEGGALFSVVLPVAFPPVAGTRDPALILVEGVR